MESSHGFCFVGGLFCSSDVPFLFCTLESSENIESVRFFSFEYDVIKCSCEINGSTDEFHLIK